MAWMGMNEGGEEGEERCLPNGRRSVYVYEARVNMQIESPDEDSIPHKK